MTAALAILAKERGGPKITFQVLFYPVTDGTNFNSSSYIKLQNGYWLTRQGMKWFWDNYAPDKAIRKQPTASPLQASIEQLRGLPPALTTTDRNSKRVKQTISGAEGLDDIMSVLDISHC
jgi:acetyl esterase/lipase